LLELLDAHADGLIAGAESGPGGELVMPVGNLDPEFQVANSGMFGAVFDAEGRAIWQSLSLIGRDFPADELPETGSKHYVHLDVPGFPPLQALLMGVEWEFADKRSAPYTFAIAVSLEPYNQRQSAFRRELVAWFGGITLTMLVVIGGLLTFVLLPLRRLERQVREVEAGERVSLTGNYPTELVGLADNLNALIETERRRLERYRHTIDDLAHALKTPLAAMRTLLAELGTSGTAMPEPQIVRLGHELERMDQRVSYQLKRARASGATGLGTEPVAVAPIVDDLRLTLDKVYRDKRVECTLAVAPGTLFRGDPGDLTEILGNLMDNAYKYCKSKVRVAGDSNTERLSLRVGDDGRGIGAELAQELGQRGKRADESVPGQGIGLAVVRETVELYRGTLSVGHSELGGAEIRIELARAGAL
jgi:two-component system sensor histidine kinase PhoQ